MDNKKANLTLRVNINPLSWHIPWIFSDKKGFDFYFIMFVIFFEKAGA